VTLKKEKEIQVISWPETVDLTIYPKDTRFPLADFDVFSCLAGEDNFQTNNPLREKALDITLDYKERVKAAIDTLLGDQVFLEAFYQEKTPFKRSDFSVDLKSRLTIAKLFSAAGFPVKEDPSLKELSFENIQTIVLKLKEMPIENLFSLLINYNKEVEMVDNPEEDPAWIKRANPTKANNFKTIAGSNAYVFFRDLIDDSSGQFGIGHIIRYVYFHRTEFKTEKDIFQMKVLEIS
jgi:hypothetical protein